MSEMTMEQFSARDDSVLTARQMATKGLWEQRMMIAEIQEQAVTARDYKLAQKALLELNMIRHMDPMVSTIHDVAKSKKVRDGDSDGKVYDGTKRERPATPAEMARGAGGRVRRGAGKAKAPQKREKPSDSDGKKYIVVGKNPQGKRETLEVENKDAAIAQGRAWKEAGYKNVAAAPKRNANQPGGDFIRGGRVRNESGGSMSMGSNGRNGTNLGPDAKPDAKPKPKRRARNSGGMLEDPDAMKARRADRDMKRDVKESIYRRARNDEADRKRADMVARRKDKLGVIRGRQNERAADANQRQADQIKRRNERDAEKVPAAEKWNENDQYQVGDRAEWMGDVWEARENHAAGGNVPPNNLLGWLKVGQAPSPLGDDAPPNNPPSDPPKFQNNEFMLGREVVEMKRESGEGVAHWRNAMVMAANGDRDGYMSAINRFLDHERANGGQEWGEGVMDIADDLLEAMPRGKDLLNGAVDNLRGWDALPGKVRADRDKKNKKDGVDPDAALAEYLLGGGDLMGAPEGADLQKAIMNNPGRFKTIGLGGAGGVSDSMWVIDESIDTEVETKIDHSGGSTRTTKQVMFLKRSAFDHDVLAEVMGGEILESTGLFRTKAPVRFASPKTTFKRDQWMLMPHTAQTAGLDPTAPTVWNEANMAFGHGVNGSINIDGRIARADGTDGGSLAELLAEGNDPTGFLRMAMFDWMIGNGGDRHLKNMLITVDREGAVDVAPVDQGLAFWNGSSDPNVSLKDFIGGERGRFGNQRPKQNFMSGLKVIAAMNEDGKRNRDQETEMMRFEFENMVEKMKSSSGSAAMRKLLDTDPPPTTEMADLIRTWFKGMDDKVAWLEANMDEAIETIQTGGK